MFVDVKGGGEEEEGREYSCSVAREISGNRWSIIARRHASLPPSFPFFLEREGEKKREGRKYPLRMAEDKNRRGHRPAPFETFPSILPKIPSQDSSNLLCLFRRIVLLVSRKGEILEIFKK